MRAYETMLVFSPELDEDAVSSAIEQARAVVTRMGGEFTSAGQLADRKGRVAEITEESGWRTRKLAFAVGRHKEAYYAVLRFKAPPEVPDELEQDWKISEDVLRYMVLRAEEDEIAVPEEE